MKETRVSAVFIGAHGSNGYSKDTRYTLKVSQQDNLIIIRVDSFKINDRLCTYESINAFLKNWTLIMAL